MGFKTRFLFLFAVVSIFSLMHTTIAGPKKQKNKFIFYKPWYCEYKPQMGPCTHFQVKYYYDSKSNSCGSFVYGGCGGNENKFDKLQTCRKVCLLPRTPPEGGF